jgi:spore coat protein A
MGAAPTLHYRLAAGQLLDGGSDPGNGWLGPTVVVPRGTSTQLTVANAVTHHLLADAFDPSVDGSAPGDPVHVPIARHLHGGNSRPADDGGPDHAFRPGDRYTYRYDNQQEATTLWYHGHAMGLTRLNVQAGLVGLYWIRDAPGTGIDTGDGRVLPPPPFEIPWCSRTGRSPRTAHWPTLPRRGSRSSSATPQS